MEKKAVHMHRWSLLNSLHYCRSMCGRVVGCDLIERLWSGVTCKQCLSRQARPEAEEEIGP